MYVLNKLIIGGRGAGGPLQRRLRGVEHERSVQACACSGGLWLAVLGELRPLMHGRLRIFLIIHVQLQSDLILHGDYRLIRLIQVITFCIFCLVLVCVHCRLHILLADVYLLVPVCEMHVAGLTLIFILLHLVLLVCIELASLLDQVRLHIMRNAHEVDTLVV